MSAIPPEIAEHILTFCTAHDFANASRTCRKLYKLIYGNDQYIWREAYLAYPFDDLRKSLRHTPDTLHDWRGELIRRVHATDVLRNTTLTAVDEQNMVEAERVIKALEVILTAIETTAAAGDPSESSSKSDTLVWAQDVLLHSSIFSETVTLQPSTEWDFDSVDYRFRQLRAHLRSYLTLSHEPGDTPESVRRLYDTRSLSRCFVYDLRNYTDHTLWGPYEAFPLEKGGCKVTVDWEHVEHIQNVVFANMRELPPMWLKPTVPRFDLHAVRPYSAPRSADRTSCDWAGVEGIWRRAVCFMDYRYARHETLIS